LQKFGAKHETDVLGSRKEDDEEVLKVISLEDWMKETYKLDNISVI